MGALYCVLGGWGGGCVYEVFWCVVCVYRLSVVGVLGWLNRWDGCGVLVRLVGCVGW
jgi:hypothetical protein